VVDFFKDLKILDYIVENKLDNLLNVDVKEYGDLRTKMEHTVYESVDPNNTTPYLPELDDQARLHFLATTRKAITILEFGVGHSTLVLADALYKNKQRYEEYVSKNLRYSNPFEIHCVDANEHFLKLTEEKIPDHLKEFVHLHYSKVIMGKFNDRICTYYEKLPNIRPDLIYLDAPDQFIAEGSVNGITTAHSDRMPMSADILTIEHFLQPGTVILIDGRTANARFLKTNFQRNWSYTQDSIADINTFELNEPPLGIFNNKSLKFCLNKNI
jgi:hypothetical protein